MQKLKIIVTGGAGFIGSHLVDNLIEKGHEVHIIDKTPKHINSKAILHVEDIANVGNPVFLNTFQGADYVFHLAAETSVEASMTNPYDYHINNITGTLNVLYYAGVFSSIKKVIFSSSSAIYGEPQYTPIDEKHPIVPLSPYALSKSVGEQYCTLFNNILTTDNLDIICLRYFNVYGDRMNDKDQYKSVISVFKEQKSKNLPLTIVNDGEQKRDFVHVKDIVEANILASLYEGKYNTFNVGTGEGYSINQIADMFGGEKKYGDKRLEPRFSISDSSLIQKELNWESKYNLETFIKKLK